MEKIALGNIEHRFGSLGSACIELLKRIACNQNEIIDHLKDKNCSPITCPFNTLIDQLAKRTKKLEFYDKQHRKEHLKK